MTYISKEKIKEKRDTLKKEFPSSKGWKISLRRRQNSYGCVILTIEESPFNLETGNLCNYIVKDVYKDREAVKKSLLRIIEIVEKGNHDNSDPMTDYFDVGFYTYYNVGSYDKPFKWNKKSIKGVVENA